jgi:polygalacturonase
MKLKLIKSDFLPKLCLILGLLFLSISSYSVNSFVNICDHGADNTGKVNSSKIINNLIDSLNKNQGGTIYFPAGNYLCGPIFMKSNITLYTDAGAIINFSDDFEDYLPMVTSQWEGIRLKTFASQIYAIDAQNIAIKGKGHFEGHGKNGGTSCMNQERQKLMIQDGSKYLMKKIKNSFSAINILPI